MASALSEASARAPLMMLHLFLHCIGYIGLHWTTLDYIELHCTGFAVQCEAALSRIETGACIGLRRELPLGQLQEPDGRRGGGGAVCTEK